MSKRILFPAIFLASYLAINYRWVRAASAAVLSQKSCDAELMRSARQSVADLFGTVKSQPIIACLEPPVLGYNISHGQANFAPGLPSVVLLGSKGMETNVAAHEWAHAEFAQRIGVISKVLFFPTWFDEGLAMQVDFREDYSQNALINYRLQGKYNSIELEDISNSKFYAAGDRGRYHYALSRCIVGEWLQDNPNWQKRLLEVSFTSPFPTEEFDNLCDLN